MNRRTTLLGAAMLLLCAPALAQRSITLDECLALAHAQSPILIEAKRSYEIARDNAQANSLSLRSQVDLTLAAPLYSDYTTPVLNPTTGLTDLLSTRVTQFGPGLTIRQPIFWTGGTLSLTSSLYRRTQLTSTGTEIQDYLGLGTVEFDQPILMANVMKMTESEAEMSLMLSRAQYTSAIAGLHYTIKNFFYGLYAAEQQLKIQQDEVSASQANYDLAQNKFKAGLIPEVESLQLEAELAIARTDLFDRERQVLSAQRSLQAALALPLTGNVSARVDTLVDVTISVDPDSAVTRALDSRAEVLSSRFDIERSEHDRARTGNTRTINAALTVTFGASQDVQTLTLLSQNPFINRGVNLIITVPLFDWGAHSMRMDAAEAATELSRTSLMVRRQQIEQEVRSAIEQLQSAERQVEVSKKSVSVAEKAYELSRERFNVGKILSQDLTLAQQRVTRARVSALTAQVAEHLALADLTQKTLFDYETGQEVRADE